MKAYTQAATSGRYATDTGLLGKYDHVRTHWEEAALCRALRPHLEAKAKGHASKGRGLRVLDIGCGSGDGLSLLQTIRREKANPAGHDPRLLTTYPLEAYRGIDLNDALLEQAEERHNESDSITFDKVDLTGGIPFAADEPGYDLYFASFGTFSHLNTEQTIRVLRDIANHAEPGALILIDWLGRFSYEWQDLWDADPSHEAWMDYRISYIYSAEERKTRDIASFPLRLVTRDEAEVMAAKAGAEADVRFEIVSFEDRSLLSGRHIDTGEYNGNPMPIREHLNSLHEPSRRTDLSQVRAHYRPRDGFDRQNEAFAQLVNAWNALIDHTATLCQALSTDVALPEPSSDGPACLTRAMHRMTQVAASLGSFHGEDKRAMLIEPQLALSLQHLERTLQPAAGCGHGLLAVFRIESE